MSESLPVQVEETKVSDEDGVKEKAEAAEGSAMQVDTDVTGEPQQQPSGEPGDKEKSATVDINTLTPSTPSQTPPQLLVGETTASGTTAVIPENILSPPKSETQTDETNTATSTSCSPASEGQRSPVTEQQPPPPQASTPPKQEQPETAAAATTVNGTIPKSGKPVSSALSAKKTSKAASTSPRASRARKPKALPMYESEISDHKVGIKLCIKKSDAGDSAPAATSPPVPVPAASKPVRKRIRKPKQPDSDEAEYEPRKKKGGGGGDGQKKVSTSADAAAADEPIEQSVWAQKLPEEVLFRVRMKRQCPPRTSLTHNLFRF